MDTNEKRQVFSAFSSCLFVSFVDPSLSASIRVHLRFQLSSSVSLWFNSAFVCNRIQERLRRARRCSRIAAMPKHAARAARAPRAVVRFLAAACLASAFALAPAPARAASRDLGHGFRDLGVAAPISNHRGYVATTDGHGRDVVLAWLMDHRGGYCLLMLDAQTGKARQFPMPFDQKGDSPYASILSSANKFYTHFGSHFVEFDPAQAKFTFCHATTPQMAMSMTEDDHGVIWSATFPQSGIVSFDPKTRAFHDYGQVYKQDWNEYPRSIAADDAGWVYFAVGMTATQIVALDPKTGKATPLLAEGERKKGTAVVFPAEGGKVYGQALGGTDGDWYELYRGKAKKLDARPAAPPARPKKIITGTQGLSHNDFPDGRKVKSLDLVNRKLIILQPDGKKTAEFSFDYASEGAIVMGVQAVPAGRAAPAGPGAHNGKIVGGTTFPMRCFTYDPKTDELSNVAAYGQWNTTAVQGGHVFVGGYGGGFLLDWDPGKPWVPTVKGTAGCNPQFLTDCDPELHRPTKTFPCPDGHTLVMAGTPQYGYTGGGLLFWDRAAAAGKDQRTLLSDAQVIPDQSTESIVSMPGDPKKIVCGTTTTPGTGGQKKARVAELYVMDLASRKVEWHAPLLPGVQEYTDLAPAPDGLVYGVADGHLFFLFDPAAKEIVYQHDAARAFGKTAHQQGPRVFIPVPRPAAGSNAAAGNAAAGNAAAGSNAVGGNGAVAGAGRGANAAVAAAADPTAVDTYMLFERGIVRIDPATRALKLVARPPVRIELGGAHLDGRLYFGSGSHVYSYDLPGPGPGSGPATPAAAKQ
jgi:hypothetical protein